MPKYSCENCNTLAELLVDVEEKVHNLIEMHQGCLLKISELYIEISKKNAHIRELKDEIKKKEEETEKKFEKMAKIAAKMSEMKWEETQ